MSAQQNGVWCISGRLIVYNMFTRSLKLGHFACVSENVLGKSRSFYSAVKRDSPRILITGKTREKLLSFNNLTFPALCILMVYSSLSFFFVRFVVLTFLCFYFGYFFNIVFDMLLLLLVT